MVSVRLGTIGGPESYPVVILRRGSRAGDQKADPDQSGRADDRGLDTSAHLSGNRSSRRDGVPPMGSQFSPIGRRLARLLDHWSSTDDREAVQTSCQSQGSLSSWSRVRPVHRHQSRGASGPSVPAGRRSGVLVRRWGRVRPSRRPRQPRRARTEGALPGVTATWLGRDRSLTKRSTTEDNPRSCSFLVGNRHRAAVSRRLKSVTDDEQLADLFAAGYRAGLLAAREVLEAVSDGHGSPDAILTEMLRRDDGRRSPHVEDAPRR